MVKEWAEVTYAAHGKIIHMVSLSKGGVAYCTYDPPTFGVLDSKDQRKFLVAPFSADFRSKEEGLLLSEDGFTAQFPYEPTVKPPNVPDFPVAMKTE